MTKHDRRKTSGQPQTRRSVSVQVPLPVLGVLTGVRQAFDGLCIATGRQVLEAMMEADREVLCGRRGGIRSSGPRGAAGVSTAR